MSTNVSVKPGDELVIDLMSLGATTYGSGQFYMRVYSNGTDFTTYNTPLCQVVWNYKCEDGATVGGIATPGTVGFQYSTCQSGLLNKMRISEWTTYGAKKCDHDGLTRVACW